MNNPVFLGYVQGMSDLCAPIYVVMGADEPLTFWCFVEVMNRMVRRVSSSLFLPLCFPFPYAFVAWSWR